MFTNFDFQDNLTSLHTAGLFSHEDLRRSAKARIIKYSRRTIAGREVFKSAGGKYAHPRLQYLDFDFERSLEEIPSWSLLEGLQKKAKNGFEIAKDVVLCIITVFAIVGFFVFILKVLFAIRLVTYGVPAASAFAPLNPFNSLQVVRSVYDCEQKVSLEASKLATAPSPQAGELIERKENKSIENLPKFSPPCLSDSAQQLRIPSYHNQLVPKIQ